MMLNKGTNIKKWMPVMARRPPRMTVKARRDDLIGCSGAAAKVKHTPTMQMRATALKARTVTGRFLSITLSSCRTLLLRRSSTRARAG
jgi:hypothetical protein